MPRLTEEEIRYHRRWLGQWRSPTDMLGYANGLMNGMANQHGIDVDLFTQAGVDFITEAGAAADFAEARGADGVRLILEDWPDLEFRFGADIRLGAEFEPVSHGRTGACCSSFSITKAFRAPSAMRQTQAVPPPLR